MRSKTALIAPMLPSNAHGGTPDKIEIISKPDNIKIKIFTIP